ncbi:MAG: MFS transporter [Burkholderiales bacterium]
MTYPALRPFRHRAFRIFYVGQTLSVLGSWMQTVATAWLVYRLSDSALLLGITAFAQQIPMLVVAPFAGLLADRRDRRRLLITVHSCSLVGAALLAALTYSGHIQVWHVISIGLALGVLNAFEAPTRQAYLLEMVPDRNDLPPAIALQSFIMNSTRLIGPSIAGVLLALYGEALCFLINAVSYIAVLVAYAIIRTAPRTPVNSIHGWWGQLQEGFRYAYGTNASRRVLILLAAFGFLVAPWQTLLPIFARESFGGDSRTFGFLIGSVGCGAVIGTLYLASRASIRGLSSVIRAAGLTTAIAMITFGFTHSFWQAVVILPMFGCALITTVSSCNQILQTIADDRMRGRLVSIYVMTFLGLAPFGNLAGGMIAEAIGAHWTFLIHGTLLLAAVLWFLTGMRKWRESLRPIYAERGVMPAEDIS